MTRLSRLLGWLSWAYLATVLSSCVIGSTLPTREQARGLEVGCSWADALVFYASCKGFAGHEAAQVVLDLPGALLYLPFFGMVALTDPVARIDQALYGLGLGILLWMPPLYLLGRSLVRRAKRRRADPLAEIP